MIAKARNESGRSERRVAPSGVSAKRPSLRSTKTPTLASARSTRWSVAASAPTARASSADDFGPPFKRSARPSFATTWTSFDTQ